ncbi:MAG: chaperone modulator CbpM [Paludibacteraceae bacterium]
MATDNRISVYEVCAYHDVEIDFIRSLRETGLIEIVYTEEAEYIPEDKLPELERMIHLYNNLDINIEGVETITHLLHRVNRMRHEIVSLRNRLAFYE